MTKVVVLEARRHGRRPRYHRGAQLDGVIGAARPEQCNLDQVGIEVRTLAALPEGLPRPWAQLCRRCWRGTQELAAALAIIEAGPATDEVPA